MKYKFLLFTFMLLFVAICCHADALNGISTIANIGGTIVFIFSAAVVCCLVYLILYLLKLRVRYLFLLSLLISLVATFLVFRITHLDEHFFVY